MTNSWFFGLPTDDRLYWLNLPGDEIIYVVRCTVNDSGGIRYDGINGFTVYSDELPTGARWRLVDIPEGCYHT